MQNIRKLVECEDRLYVLNTLIENSKYRENVDYYKEIQPLEEERKDIRRMIYEHRKACGFD